MRSRLSELQIVAIAMLRTFHSFVIVASCVAVLVCAGCKQNPTMATDPILSITSFTPHSTHRGEQIKITGTGFNPVDSLNIVEFVSTKDSNANASGHVDSVTGSTSLTLYVTVPEEANSGRISVIVGTLKCVSTDTLVIVSGSQISPFRGVTIDATNIMGIFRVHLILIGGETNGHPCENSYYRQFGSPVERHYDSRASQDAVNIAGDTILFSDSWGTARGKIIMDVANRKIRSILYGFDGYMNRYGFVGTDIPGTMDSAGNFVVNMTGKTLVSDSLVFHDPYTSGEEGGACYYSTVTELMGLVYSDSSYLRITLRP